MRHLILFMTVFLATFPARAEKPDAAKAAAQAMTLICLPSLAERTEPAAMAVKLGLPELPQEDAAKFAPGARVFGLTGSGGMAVLMTNSNVKGVCSVAVHKVSPQTLWKQIETDVLPKARFHLMREKRDEPQKVTKRDYEGPIGAARATFLITVSDVPRPNGIQALMTMALVKD